MLRNVPAATLAPIVVLYTNNNIHSTTTQYCIPLSSYPTYGIQH